MGEKKGGGGVKDRSFFSFNVRVDKGYNVYHEGENNETQHINIKREPN